MWRANFNLTYYCGLRRRCCERQIAFFNEGKTRKNLKIKNWANNPYATRVYAPGLSYNAGRTAAAMPPLKYISCSVCVCLNICTGAYTCSLDSALEFRRGYTVYACTGKRTCNCIFITFCPVYLYWTICMNLSVYFKFMFKFIGGWRFVFTYSPYLWMIMKFPSFLFGFLSLACLIFAFNKFRVLYISQNILVDFEYNLTHMDVFVY